MLDRNGTLRWVSCLVFVISPPRMTVWPSSAATVVSAVVVLIGGWRITSPVAEMDTGVPSDSGPRADFSAMICITTSPSGLIRGVTRRISPMSSGRTWLVWPASLMAVPRIKETRWPTWMKASWLSSVMTWGRLRTSSRPHSCRARTRTLTLSLAAERTRPP